MAAPTKTYTYTNMFPSENTCDTCGQDTTAIVAAAAVNRKMYPIVWFINVKMDRPDQPNYRIGFFTSKEKAQVPSGGFTRAVIPHGHVRSRQYEFFATTSAELSDLEMEKLDRFDSWGGWL